MESDVPHTEGTGSVCLILKRSKYLMFALTETSDAGFMQHLTTKFKKRMFCSILSHFNCLYRESIFLYKQLLPV